jgi:hypothetical protein
LPSGVITAGYIEEFNNKDWTQSKKTL